MATLTQMTTVGTQALNPRRMKELDQLCDRMGVHFGRMGLLNEALTHSSFASEQAGAKDNERLEFFGDAVLKFVISEYLLERFPEYDEGQLTEIRSWLVSDKTIAVIADTLNLSKYILLGGKVQMRQSILAMSMEAVLGAVYMDLGLMQVQNLIVRLFGGHATTIDQDETKENYKAELQELSQSKSQGVPTYVVTDVDGPAHEPIFTVVVSVAGQSMASGSGKSKKAAEQEAARHALIQIANKETVSK